MSLNLYIYSFLQHVSATHGPSSDNVFSYWGDVDYHNSNTSYYSINLTVLLLRCVMCLYQLKTRYKLDPPHVSHTSINTLMAQPQT
jgi:hypothetical protein